MKIAQLAASLCLSAAFASTCTMAIGQVTGYPNRTVTMILPITPGGNPDVLARVVAEKLTQRLGRSFVVDNRPGSGGNIGAGYAAKAPADGYTLAVLTSAEMCINPHIYANLPYSPKKDFVPIAVLAIAPTVLAIDASLPVKTLAEFVEYVKARPGQLNYGSSGNGSIQQFTAVMFANQAGIRMTHIPYKGSAQTVPALVSGEIQAAFVGIPLARDLAEKGRIRILAISSDQRSKGMPSVPTLAESGVPGFNVATTMGLFAPAATPDGVRRLLADEVAQVLRDPDVQQRLIALGMQLTAMTPDEYTSAMDADSARYGQAVREAGIRID